MNSLSSAPPSEDKDEWIARIALSFSLKHQLGNLHKLVNYFPDAQSIFRADAKSIEEVFGKKLSKNIQDVSYLKEAEEEFKKTKKNHIELCYCKEDNYPAHLFHCEDRPLILYKKGEKNIPFRRMIAIVGSRKCSTYGARIVRDIVSRLRAYHPLIVSGLAYGIDALAHEAAIENKLKTAAVLGNGLGRIYPPSHYNLADDIAKNGAIYTEYSMDTPPDKFHFPMRNRIVAGMSVGVVVVETDIQGGAMITASLACAYNREVMAIPHPIYGESAGAGCHLLIKKNMATLVENGDDIARVLGWDDVSPERSANVQTSIDKTLLSEEEKTIVRILEKQEKVHIDALGAQSNIEQRVLSLRLLELEMRGVIKKLPGNFFCLL